MVVADREGFEPSIELPLYTRSRRAPSTTRPPVHSTSFRNEFGAESPGADPAKSG